MAAKQRHIQRVRRRIQDKLNDIDQQEEMLHTVIQEYVAKVKSNATAVISLEDAGQFLQQYSSVLSELDICYNTCEFLTASAEDMIENGGGDMSTACRESRLDLTVTTPVWVEPAGSERTSTPNTLDESQTKLRVELSDPKSSKAVKQTEVKAYKSEAETWSESKLCGINSHEVHDDIDSEADNDSSLSTADVSQAETVKQKKNTEKKSSKLKLPLPVPDIVKQQLNRETRPEKDASLKQERSKAPEVVLSDGKLGRPYKEETKGKSSPSKKSKRKKGSNKMSALRVDVDCSTITSEIELSAEVDHLNKSTSIQNVKEKTADVTSEKTSHTPSVSSCTQTLDSGLKRESFETFSVTSSSTSVSEKFVTPKSISDEEVPTSAISDPSKESSQKHTKGPKIAQTYLAAGKVSPVLVSDITSPWCFYVQPFGPQLTHLMEQICFYMKDRGLREPPLKNPEPGTICLAQFSKDNAFYRAIITRTHTAETGGTVTEVEVIYVDYGNRERVPVSRTRELPDIFALLPTQAICCSLSEVMPNNKYDIWTEHDIITFTTFVASKQVDCIPVCRSSDPGMPCLVQLRFNVPVPNVACPEMYMSQFNVGQMLINKNLAKYVDVTEQMSMLMKSLAWDEEFLIFNGRNAHEGTGGLAIKELTESYVEEEKKPVQIEDIIDVKLESTANLDQPDEETDVQHDSSACIKTDPKNHTSSSSSSSVTEMSDTESARAVSVTVQDTSPSPSENSKQTDLTNIKEESDSDTGETSSSTSKSSHSDIKSFPSGTKSSDSDSKPKQGLDKMSQSEEKSASSDSDTLFGDDKVQERLPSEEMTCDTNITGLSKDGASLSGEVTHDVNLNPQGYQVIVSHVSSPSLFYIHIVSQHVGRTLDNLMKNLNLHFEKLSNRKLQRLSKFFKAEVNKACCAQYTRDQFFYRAVILTIEKSANSDSSQDKIHVYYPDFGDNEWLPRQSVYPLPQEFVNIPPLVIRCSLAYIKPVDSRPSGEGESMVWDQKAVDKFVSLTGFEKMLYMHVIQGQLSLDTQGDVVDAVSLKQLPLSVVLVDYSGEEEVCINMEMIHIGEAMLDSTSAAAPDTSAFPSSPVPLSPSSPQDMANWDPMAEQYFSMRNSYHIDIDDPGVATVGYSASDENKVCKYYRRGTNNCFRGERCPYLHVEGAADAKGVTVRKEEVFAICNNQQELLPEVGSWVAMEICTILSPGRFYALLPMGKNSLDSLDQTQSSESYLDMPGTTESLEGLQSSLNEEYQGKPYKVKSLIHRAPGEVVVAKYSRDRQYYRARVLSVSEDKIKVFYLDFGNREWLTLQDVQDIEPQFLHLPFQALECFLNNIEPANDSDMWSTESKKSFRELVDGKTLVGHIRSRSWNGCLWVELYDTSGDDDINIGEELVRRGHAQQSSTLTETLSSTPNSRRSSTGSCKFIPG